MSDDGESSYRTYSSLDDYSDASTEAESEELVDEDERYKLLMIEEVKTRPPLWEKWKTDAKSKSTKDRLWLEVVSLLHEKEWRDLSEQQKQCKVKRAQKKWKNMRDCYARVLTKLQNGEKVKRYRYFQQMHFLKAVVESSRRRPFRALKRDGHKGKPKRPRPGASGGSRTRSKSKRPRLEATSNQVSQRTRDDGPSRQPSKDPAPIQKSVGTSTRDLTSSILDPACPKTENPGTSSVVRHDEEKTGGPSSGFATRTESGSRMGTPVQVALVDLLPVKQEREIDEDINFVLSLVPLMKELDYDKKHFAKTKILDVMKNARYFVLDQMDLPVPLPEARTPQMDEQSSPNASHHEASEDEPDSNDGVTYTKWDNNGPRK